MMEAYEMPKILVFVHFIFNKVIEHQRSIYPHEVSFNIVEQ